MTDMVIPLYATILAMSLPGARNAANTFKGSNSSNMTKVSSIGKNRFFRWYVISLSLLFLFFLWNQRQG